VGSCFCGGGGVVSGRQFKRMKLPSILQFDGSFASVLWVAHALAAHLVFNLP
jgi:CO dehydrogenase/acetyl-CoA synthase beta subunit